MSRKYSIYCDESCHLEHDGHRSMTLGAVWCPSDKIKEITRRIREIKVKHHVGRHQEVKWKRASPSKAQLHLDLIDYFFDDDDIHFRGLIVSDKSKLRHAEFNQTHDQWYYKMYFELLYLILSPTEHYRIYLDIKDTLGGARVRELHTILCNSKYDFERQIIESIQVVRSHEVEIFQLVDVLTGALSYANRSLHGSQCKQDIVNRIKQRSRYTLTRSTLMREKKMNILWEPSEPII